MDEHKKTSLFDTMPPKFAFWAGVVTAVGAVAVIGFGLMLALLFKGVDFDSGSTGKTNSNTAAANTNSGSAGSGATNFDRDALRDVRGSGDLTVVEFSDIDCPFCKQFHPTMQKVIEQYDGQISWSYMHFPLTSLHPNAQVGAEATECAAQQDKYYDYLDAYFTNDSSAGEDKILAVAKEAGVDLDEFATCRDSGETKATVDADAALAQSMGCTGTPCSVIIDKDGEVVGRVPGALPLSGSDQSMTAILDALL